MLLSLRLVAVSCILCASSLQAFAINGLVPEKYSAAQNVYPQHPLKGDVLKSSFPKAKKSEKTKSKARFTNFIAKKILVNASGKSEDITKLALEKYIGTEITAEKLTKIKDVVEKYYVSQDYLSPQVVFNSKLIEKGVLQLNVHFVKISNVTVIGEGNNNKLMQEYIENITAQNPARKSYTEKMLGLMNKIPGFEVVYELSPRPESAHNNIVEANLMLITTKKKANIFAGANNFSPNDLGKYQFSLLNEIYTPFTNSDSLILHGATTNYPDRLHDFGVGYGHILNSYGTSANIMTSYSKDDSNSNTSSALPNSRSDLVKGSIVQQILLDENQDLEVELGVKHLSSVQYQTDTNGFSQKSNVSKYTTGIFDTRYLLSDKFAGNNLFNLNFVQGLAGTEEDFVDNNSLPKKHFNKISLSYVRDQKIIDDFSAYLNSAMSHSNHVLPNAEKPTIGGNVFGRGYAFATLQGSKMKAAALELRYTKHNLNEYIKQLQPYLFVDHAHVNISDANTNISNLESYGAGLRFRFIHKIDLGMEVAQPRKREFMVDGDNMKAKTKFNIFINKVFEF